MPKHDCSITGDVIMDKQTLLTEYIQNELMKGRSQNFSIEEDLLSSGILDSLGILQLVTFIDDKLNLQVPDEDVVYENFNSVAALSNYLDTLK